MRMLTWLLTHAVALGVATWLLDGLSFPGPTTGQAEITEKIGPLLVVAVILGLVSSLVKPVVMVLSLPFIVVTLGLLWFVLNALMLLLVAWIADQFDVAFRVDGFWSAVAGSLVITVVAWLVHLAVGQDR